MKNVTKVNLFFLLLMSFIANAIAAETDSSKGGTPIVRTVAVTNNTGGDIWVGITTASVSCATTPAKGSDSLCPTQAAGSCGNGGVTCIGGKNKVDSGWCGDYPWDSVTGFCYQKLPVVNNPNEADSTSLHLASGKSLTLTAPASTPTNIPFVWSGNMFARTGCSSGTKGNTCQMGDCGAANDKNNYDSGGMCPPGAGGFPQGTLAEVTMANPAYIAPDNAPALGPDYYDISIINGVNVAATIGPVDGKTSTQNAYVCTTAGSTKAQGALKACSWIIEPVINDVDYASYLSNIALPSALTQQTPQQPVGSGGLCTNPSGSGTIPPNKENYCQCAGSTKGNLVYPDANHFCPDPTDLSVYPNADGYFKSCNNNTTYPNSYGYCECTNSSQCGSDQSCGVALNASASQQYTQACGTFIGWTTADTLCGTNEGVNTTPFLKGFCNEHNANGSVTNYLGCSGSEAAATSCYNIATTSGGYEKSCCGCGTSSASQTAFPNVWPTVQTGTGPDNGCYGNSADWNKYVQPTLVYLKNACPTAYVYPFDDATSTFTCNSTNADATSWPNYQLNFQPLLVEN